MDADDRQAALDRLREFVLANRRAFLRAPRAYTNLDPEDLLHTAYSKALAILARARTPEAREATLADLCRRDYWFRALRNVSHDLHDKVKRELVTDEQTEPEWLSTGYADPVATEVVGRIAAEDRSAALANVLRVLTGRCERHPGPVNQVEHPHLTPAQWAVLQVLGELVLEDRPTRGMQTEAARRLGITRQTVSEHVRSIHTQLQLTRYLAGVLAAPRTLRHAAAIDAALNAYEDWLTPLPAPTAAPLIRALAGTVRTYDASGTRARLELLTSAAADADEVHALETDYATAAGNPLPNCAACCVAHNLTPDRTTEF